MRQPVSHAMDSFVEAVQRELLDDSNDKVTFDCEYEKVTLSPEDVTDKWLPKTSTINRVPGNVVPFGDAVRDPMVSKITKLGQVNIKVPSFRVDYEEDNDFDAHHENVTITVEFARERHPALDEGEEAEIVLITLNFSYAKKQYAHYRGALWGDKAVEHTADVLYDLTRGEKLHIHEQTLELAAA